MDQRLKFGLSIDPAAAEYEDALWRAQIADQHDLDMITIMDHPYNAALLDTWTLITALAIQTERVQVGANVLNLPLRPPAMLAKMAASLDFITGGRIAVGIGAGAYWDGIAAWGGPRRVPGEAYNSIKDALHILRGLWANAGDSFSYAGEVYQVQGAKLGPAPAHAIPIWVGARGPRTVRLVGRMADGLLISYNHVPPDQLPRINAGLDEGAAQASRPPTAIRRGYNLMGVIDVGREDTSMPGLKAEFLNGSVAHWVERMVEWATEARQDTFIFWPIAGNKRVQIEAFVHEIVPAVKARLE